MKVKKIEHLHYVRPIPVYDVIKARPNHNFVITSQDTELVAHNCGML